MQHPVHPGHGSPRGQFPPPQRWGPAPPSYGAAGAPPPSYGASGAPPNYGAVGAPPNYGAVGSQPIAADRQWSGQSDELSPTDASPKRGRRRNISEHSDRVLREQAIDLHQDTYSWLLLTLVKHWQAQNNGGHDDETDLAEVTYISLIHAVFVWAFSVLLELCVVVFFLAANLELGEKVQDAYFQQHYHMDLHRAAEALRKSAADGVAYSPPDILQACVQQASWANMTWIYYVTLTFWLMTMVTEVKEAVWVAIHIVGVNKKQPYTETGEINRSSLLYEDEDKGLIVRLQDWQKGFLLFVVPAFRVVISLVLTFSGAKYLILSTTVTDMVVKTVALQFVIKMDNVAAESLLTMGDMEELRKVKIHTQYGHPHRDSLWDRGLGGMFYITLIALTLVLLTEFVYGDVFAFRYACGAYNERFPIEGVKNMMKFVMNGPL